MASGPYVRLWDNRGARRCAPRVLVIVTIGVAAEFSVGHAASSPPGAVLVAGGGCTVMRLSKELDTERSGLFAPRH